PAVNQVESHPRNWNDVIINYSLAQEVVPEAWGPLTRVSDQAKEKLSEIGAKYNKTWAQVILRYQIERGVVVIPKSHNQKRQEQNLEIFDFKLSDEDKQFISAQ
ncbi:aldo/keto reductase, partial [Tetragenococcus halophilus]